MRTIALKPTSRVLHAEAPGCIINIHTELRDNEGREVTSIEILANGNRYAGEPAWWLPDFKKQKTSINVCVVRDKEAAL